MSERARIIERPTGHARILGSPRGGKTALLVERFHQLARDGHRPLVIAFGREQHDRLLEQLIPPGTARFGPTPVTTHGMLASHLLSAARPGRARTLRDVDERVVLDRVMEPGVLESDLRSIADSRSLRDTLLASLHLLAQNGVTIAQADQAAKASHDARAADVLRLYSAYRAYLDKHRLATFYDAAWGAAHEVTNDPTLARTVGSPDVLLVDDAHDLDPGQFALLRALAPPDGTVALELYGDASGPRFSFRGTSDRFLLDEFPAAYHPTEFQLAPAPCADRKLNTAIDRLRAQTTRTGERAQTTHSKEGAPAPAALGTLPLFATATAATSTPPQPDEISAHAPWNVSITAVRASDEIAEAQHAAATVTEWLQDGIAPNEIAIVARDPDRIASLFHQTFRERGVPIDVGARADTAADGFVHNLVGALGRDADGRFAEALATSPLLAGVCADMHMSPRDVDRFVASLRAQYAGKNGFDLAHLLDDTMGRVESGKKVVAAIREDWRRYTELVERSGGHASLDEFRRAYLDGATRNSPIDNLPRLVSARAISGRTVRAAVVVGCADGIFPRVATENSYLSTVALSAALSGINQGAARDFAARADRDTNERAENALLLSTLSAASDAVEVSCAGKYGNEHLDPAPVLAEMFANATDVTRVMSPAAHAAAGIATRAPGDALATATRALDPIVFAWLAKGPAAQRPLLPGSKLSPSGIDNFMRCARRYFYTKVLYIQEPGSIYLDIGNIFHGVMKRALREGLSSDEVRALLETGDFTAAIDEAIAEGMNNESPWLQDLTRVHMRNMVRRVAGLEAQRILPYTVRMVEQRLELKVGDDVALRGQVDRIDDVAGLGPLVVDYKTGKLNKTAASLIDELEQDGKHWQVPIYAALAATEGSRPVAFLFYATKDEGHVSGMQLVDGPLPPPISDKGKSNSRYGRLAAATIDTKLEEALALRAALVAGEQAFERTDSAKECGRCHFIHVCRRSHV